MKQHEQHKVPVTLRGALISALIGAVTLAGCGGGDAGNSNSHAAEPTALRAPSGPAAEAALEWVEVAAEWQPFDLAAAATVRYGAGSTWVERSLPAGRAFCTNDFFGGDPLPGIVKRCEMGVQDAAGSWVFAASENGTFTLAAASRVRYGAGSTWLERDLPAGQASCSNGFFGSDPLFGVVKRCEIRDAGGPPPPPPPPPPTAGWTFVADEWAAFTLNTATLVRYGAGSTWAQLQLAAGVHSCTNGLFGDPLPGTVKRCEAWNGGGVPSISAFAPTSGPVSTVVVVSGAGLDSVSGASVGGAQASFVIVSASEVRVTVPPGATSGRIALTSGSTATISGSDFTVTQPSAAPTVSSVSPTSVAPGGQITVSGSSLNEVASARLGSVTLAIVSQSSTSLVLSLPAGATSGTLVLVDRAGGARDAATIQVLVPMAVSGFAPSTVARGQALTITGQGLDRATTARFVGADAPVASRNGSTSVTVTVPLSASSGRVTVISNAGDQATSNSDVAIVDAITVISQVHRVGVGGTVTVNGTGLDRVRNVVLGGVDIGLAARSAGAVSFTVPGGVLCADIALRLDDGSLIAAGSVVTGSDCGLRAAGVEFAQLLSQRADDGRLRLSAGKETWVRAFVASSNAGTPSPVVRAQGVDASGRELGSVTMSGPSSLPVLASGAAVPDSLRYDDSRAFRAELPASWVQPGLRVRVHAGESQDPSTVIEASPAIADSGGVRVVLVPLWSGPYGPSMPALDIARQMVERRLPIAGDRIDVSIRMPYALTSVTGGVLSSAQWSSALSELESLRDREAPAAVYFGMVQPRTSSGIAGIGYVNSAGGSSPALSAIGWDASTRDWSQTMIHELGHNFSRRHAPCGSVSTWDTAFPHAGGTLGSTPAFDPGTNELVPPGGQYDVMGYCDGTFFSDYNLRGVMAFLEARPAPLKSVLAQAAAANHKAGANARQWLVVRGAVDADGARVDAVRAVTDTDAPAVAGGPGSTHALRLTTRDGSVVEHPFDAVEVDHIDGESHFTLRVANPGALRRIEVLRAGKVIFTRDGDAVAASVNTRAGKARAGSSQVSVRAAAGQWTMTWDAAAHAHASLALVVGGGRQVLAVDATGGRWTIPAAMLRDLPPGGHLELGLSNGIDTLLLKLDRP